jgi:hypothetical protein
MRVKTKPMVEIALKSRNKTLVAGVAEATCRQVMVARRKQSTMGDWRQLWKAVEAITRDAGLSSCWRVGHAPPRLEGAW